MKQIIIIEKINFYLFFKYFFQYFIFSKKKHQEFFYVYSSNSFKLLNFIFKSYSKKIKKIDFNFNELKINNKQNVYIDYNLKDFHLLFLDILKDLNLNIFINDKNFDYFTIFFKKKIFEGYVSEFGITLLLIYATHLKIKIPNKESKVVLILNKSPWWRQLKKFFNKKFEIDFIFVNNFNYTFNIIKKYIKLSPLYYFLLLFKIIKFEFIKVIELKYKYISNLRPLDFPIIIDTNSFFIFNSKFWIEKFINSKKALFVSRYYYPEAEKKIKKNNKSRFNFFILSSNFNYTLIDYFKYILKFINKSLNFDFFVLKNEYEREKIIWKKTFQKFNTKIYITSHKWDSGSVIACKAINDLQGISIHFQSSYYEIPGGDANIKADIYFSFSNKINNLEKLSGSQISYNISCGYINDYLYCEVKEKSNNLRKKLKKNGCKKIIAIFDQEYLNEKKWFYGKDYYQNFLIFWLEKIIKEPWLGLVIKQKKPALMFLEPNNPYKLTEDFKDLNTLLKKALSTGRCYFYLNRDEFSIKNYNDTVAEAAMAADLSIHTMLYAGTAGVESALAGTPTLYYDDLNFKESKFYNLGNNNVVFNNWDIMWEKINDYFNNQKIIGDWSNILDDIDPFRDGKAYLRINQFISWLEEGYKKSDDKNNVIAYAVKKYSDIWGADKIIKNN